MRLISVAVSLKLLDLERYDSPGWRKPLIMYRNIADDIDTCSVAALALADNSSQMKSIQVSHLKVE